MRRGSKRVAAVLLLSLTAGTAVAAGQPAPEPEAPPRIQIGPVRVDPSMALKDVGIDSNVLNDPEHPQEDFTATASPGVDASIRLRDLRISMRSAVDFVYFQTLKDQQSANTRVGADLAVLAGRFRPLAGIEMADTRERPTSEIDARARRSDELRMAGIAIFIAPRAALVVDAVRKTSRFAEGEIFQDVSLRETLSLTQESASAGLRVELTPLTTFDLGVRFQRDRFPFSPGRDADSVSVAPTFRFAPDALVRGAASVGYRRFRPRAADLPEFTGVTAAIGVAYTLPSSTRLEVDFVRDIGYSYELLEPYYVTTGGRVRVTQRLVGPLEAVADGGRERLDYRAIVGEAGPRADDITVLGGGLGYRIGESARFGIEIEAASRRSNTERGRGFDRTRVLGSATYGF